MLPAGGDPCKTPWLSPLSMWFPRSSARSSSCAFLTLGMRDETLPELTHLLTSVIPTAQFRREVPSYVLLVAFLMYLALAYRSPSWRDRDTPNEDLTAGSGMSKAP